MVAEAKNGMEAYEQTKIHQPQVVLMDIRMPQMGGVEATRLIKGFPETAVLVLTTYDDDESILGAIANGASGYLKGYQRSEACGSHS